MLKSFPKILTIFFLIIFIFQLASLIFLFVLPQVSQAADPATFKPQVEIPGMDKEFGATDPKTGGYAIPGSTASIAKYIKVIYKYAIGIVGILAAVVLMVGGVMWIVAGGNATAIGEAKAWIGASLTGLVLALMSYLILATVNPALVDLKTTTIQTVATTATSTNSTNYDTCCKTDSECVNKKGSGYICNTAVSQAQLLVCNSSYSDATGICQALGSTAEGGVCQPSNSTCATGLHCYNYRCVIEDWELPGLNPGDPCGDKSTGYFKCTTADTILGIPKCPSGYTHYGFGGRSCGSNLMCCKKD